MVLLSDGNSGGERIDAYPRVSVDGETVAQEAETPDSEPYPEEFGRRRLFSVKAQQAGSAFAFHRQPDRRAAGIGADRNIAGSFAELGL